jgi:WD40 repeat protein
MLKVYIEESAFAAPQPMEVSADAPLSKVVPALVEELHLPSTDLFGNRLVYFLRHTVDGRVLPDHLTLGTAGIQQEDHLALESYVADEGAVLAAPRAQSASQSPAFYADQTIADASMFLTGGNPVPSSQVVLPAPQPAIAGALPAPNLPASREKRWTRRALLMAGGAVLGVTGAGLAYAALRGFSGTHLPLSLPFPASGTIAPATGTMQAGATAQPQATLPTRATSLLVFARHQQTVRAVAWSPGGTLLASGANDALLLTWDLNGQVQMRRAQNAAVRAVTWSPDSRQLAAAFLNRILFLNVQNGTVEAQSTHTHHGTVTTLAWSPQQQLLVSAGLDQLAVVWNTQTFRPQTLFRQHTAGILSASWAADGQTVGTCSQGGVIRVWNGPGGQQVHGFFFDGAVTMNALAFEPGGSRLAVGGADGVLRLWQSGLTCQLMGNNNAQGQCMDKPRHLTAHTQAIRAVAWSPDGRLLASAGEDGVLLIWFPAQSATPLLKIQHNAPVLSISWSPDGRKIAAASGNTVTLWSLV